MKKTIIIISIILALIIAGIIGASFYFYNVAVKRADKDFLNSDPNLAVSTPQTLQTEAKKWAGTVNFEEIAITSNDGLALTGYYLPAEEKTNKTVIIAHGYAGHAIGMYAYAKYYYEALGYNVLMPDARGHGKSEGDYIGFGWHERKDYIQWIDYVLDRNGKNSKIALHGVSMGGATVMMTSGEELPKQVKAVVADCGYTSALDILSYQLGEMYSLPSFPLIQSTSLLTKLRAGYSFEEASAVEQVKKTSLPIFFIHGEKDTFVPLEMVHELYEAANGEKELYIVPGAEHGNAYNADPETYEKKVAEFLASYMK
ncbi:alpha/beta hydrolase [Pradoshia eiseniae]|uniref:Alpha/beta hydrolase n=1 Tax=Pradoshia eiseniae TaxID=2064768 RepID=A0A2S7N4D7_9BACI|nr:alpha/beta hydrolase [Pradoshia eiseniae]PQD96830.1 alpha/beta hydrolase [Pradoshia eiseniae]